MAEGTTTKSVCIPVWSTRRRQSSRSGGPKRQKQGRKLNRLLDLKTGA